MALWAAAALGGCQLPVAFGGFGVFTGNNASGNQGDSPNPTDQNPANGGSTNTLPVATTGGGVPQGDIGVGGSAQLDDRASHAEINVTLRSGERSTTKRTDAQGGYRFEKVAPGSYTLTVAKAGYRAQQVDVFLERNNQQLPGVTLISPISGVALSAATDTVYVAPADSKDFAILPFTVQVKAHLTKENGDLVDGNSATIAWASLDPVQAGVGGEGVVVAAPTAVAGSVTILATSKADPTIAGSLVLQVRDPGSIADVRVLSVGARLGFRR